MSCKNKQVGGSKACEGLSQLACDPCYKQLCCSGRASSCYKPFVPSYERCDEEISFAKLLGFDYQRRWFCERNIWMCQVYGVCGGSRCF